MVPKCEKDAKEISEICNAFQTCAYPMLSGYESASRVVHPPVWHVDGMGPSGVSNLDIEKRWTFKILPSVLSDVSINSSPEGNYHFDGGYPAVTNLSVKFQELEPAVSSGNVLKSRSQVK